MQFIEPVVIISAMIALSYARLADDITDPSLSNNCIIDQCFHQPIESCPSPESKCRCLQLQNCKFAAICCNISSKAQLIESLACANITANTHIDAIHIRNATLNKLNVDEWKRLKYLRYMTITDGRINSVVGEFVKHTHISCLNLSSNSIVNFENRALVNLYNLSFLDLSHNNLSSVPRFKKDGNITLDISANKPMVCTNVNEALKRTELHFSNENDTFCWFAPNFHWFNSTEFISIAQVIVIHELRKVCYRNCTCELTRHFIMPHATPSYAISVNCSGLNLDSLPPLPPNTVSLDISNNNITSLEPLNTDPSYRNLQKLYANNNQIGSVLPLEGSYFFNHFLELSLRNNNFKSLPTYMFSNVFDRNGKMPVHLGLNRLKCDCNTAKVLKVWLLTKQKSIQDYEEIYCENTDLRVIDLKPSNMCQIPQDWTDYIYYIITAEIFLLIVLIAKVVYDYCVFKSSGYLPWPANKMPKLPCDWLCE